MRRAPYSILMLLLALCVGFQSTASAVAKRCPHDTAAPAAGPTNLQGSAHHDHAAMTMDTIGREHHAGHGMASAADHSTFASGHTGCDCGAQCASLDCVVQVPGIVSLAVSRQLEMAPPLFALPAQNLHPRAAHARDLIRPPSRS